MAVTARDQRKTMGKEARSSRVERATCACDWETFAGQTQPVVESSDSMLAGLHLSDTRQGVSVPSTSV